MERKELIKSPEYWTANAQLDLYREILKFMDKNHMNRSQLAEYLGCTRGYVSQVLSGTYDHKLSKFVELAIAIGKIPEITYKDLDEYIIADSNQYQGEQVCLNETHSFTNENYNEPQYFPSILVISHVQKNISNIKH